MTMICKSALRKMPSINLDYLESLTDHIGLYQHATFGVPNLDFGYTTDDNCRALIVVSKYFDLYNEERAIKLARRYLAFLQWVQREDGYFRNEVSIDRQFLDEVGSEDAQARTFWALAWFMNTGVGEDLKGAAKQMLERFLPNLFSLQHPRPWAFILKGLEGLSKNKTSPVPLDHVKAASIFGERLLALYKEQADASWRWFEDIMTWGNALLPSGLFSAYKLTGRKEFLTVARESFEFLCEKVFEREMFMPVGNRGWYHKNGTKPVFDQQPIEAMWMLIASLEAAEFYSPEENLERARSAVEWYFGKNIHRLSLYNPLDGSCADGLTPQGLNANRGAESTISCLLSMLIAQEKNLLEFRPPRSAGVKH